MFIMTLPLVETSLVCSYTYPCSFLLEFTPYSSVLRLFEIKLLWWYVRDVDVLVRWTPDREVRIRALAGSLCCVLVQDTLLSQ